VTKFWVFAIPIAGAILLGVNPVCKQYKKRNTASIQEICGSFPRGAFLTTSTACITCSMKVGRKLVIATQLEEERKKRSKKTTKISA